MQFLGKESAWKVKRLGGTGDGRGGSCNTGESGGASAKPMLKPWHTYFLCASNCWALGIATEGLHCELQAKWVRT